MLVHGTHSRTVWMPEPGVVCIIDQRKLPWAFEIIDLQSVAEVTHAIRDMTVRGAGCIGATAGYGMALAACEAQNESQLEALAQNLIETRPTAVNLAWAVNRQLDALRNQPAAACGQIGLHGLELIREIEAK